MTRSTHTTVQQVRHASVPASCLPELGWARPYTSSPGPPTTTVLCGCSAGATEDLGHPSYQPFLLRAPVPPPGQCAPPADRVDELGAGAAAPRLPRTRASPQSGSPPGHRRPPTGDASGRPVPALSRAIAQWVTAAAPGRPRPRPSTVTSTGPPSPPAGAAALSPPPGRPFAHCLAITAAPTSTAPSPGREGLADLLGGRRVEWVDLRNLDHRRQSS